MLCIFTKWKISFISDQDKPLPKALQAHIESCENCRNFYNLLPVYQNQHQISSDEAPALAPYIKARILDDLENIQNKNDSVSPQFRLKLWRPAVAIAMVCFITTVSVFLYNNFKQNDSNTLSGINLTNIWYQISGVDHVAILSTDPQKISLSNLLGESTLASEISSLQIQARHTAVFLMERIDPGLKTSENLYQSD